MKKLISVLAALCLMMALIPTAAFAEGEEMSVDQNNAALQDVVQEDSDSLKNQADQEDGSVQEDLEVKTQGLMEEEPEPPVKDGWEMEDGGWKYYVNGNPVSGFKTINSYRYFFGPDGVLLAGWRNINGNTYYFEENGKYPASDSYGRMHKGWLTRNGKKYYLNPSNGIRVTGWLKLNGKKYYLNQNGTMRVGWLKLDSYKYYLNTNGTMKTGWLSANGSKYYFNTKTGRMSTGWTKINGARYYFNMFSGKITKGWMNLQGARYYLDKSSGKMKTGWLTLNGKKYYLDPKTGKMKTGFLKLKKKTYYLDPKTGRMKTGLSTIKKNRYYFNKKGVMQTGVVKLDGELYYFAKDGKAQKHKGWFKGSDKKKRYCYGKGRIAFGKEQIGDIWYVFNKKDGSYIGTLGDNLDSLVAGKTSSTGYIVAVSRAAHIVRVYTGSSNKWTKAREFDCIVGGGSSTPKGTFHISKRKYMESENKLCWWYCTKFKGERQFNSLVYNYDPKNPPKPGKSGLAYSQPMKSNISNGDIRLTLSASKWIYDNLKNGTTVVIE